MKISRRNLKIAINEALGSGAMARLKIAIDKEYKKGKQEKDDPSVGYARALTLLYSKTGGKTPTKDQEKDRKSLKDYLDNDTDYAKDKMSLGSWGKEEDEVFSDDPEATAKMVSPDKYLVRKSGGPELEKTKKKGEYKLKHTGHEIVRGARSGDKEERMMAVKSSSGKSYAWKDIMKDVIGGKKLLKRGAGGSKKKNSKDPKDRMEFAQVKAVQTLLKDAGHDPGSIDGSYGSGTRNAVRSFQKKLKLKVDGAVGRQTARAFNPSVAAQKIPITGALPGDLAESLTRNMLRSLISQAISNDENIIEGMASRAEKELGGLSGTSGVSNLDTDADADADAGDDSDVGEPPDQEVEQ